MYDCGKDCLILIPFRLPQIRCFTCSLKCFSSDSRQLPRYGDQIPASVLPPTKGRCSTTNTPVFLLVPSSYLVLHQVLLSALSWCSACTSVPEGVFLMYPWKEVYSMSTYSSTILFCPGRFFITEPQINQKKKYIYICVCVCVCRYTYM